MELEDVQNIRNIWSHIWFSSLYHSDEKRKDSLECSLDWVLFAAELEFPKILVPRLPQNTSNVNTECTEKSKELYFLCDHLLVVLIYFILLFWYKFTFNWLCLVWIMQYMVAALREQLQEYQYTGVTLNEKHCCSYYLRCQLEKANQKPNFVYL